MPRPIIAIVLVAAMFALRAPAAAQGATPFDRLYRAYSGGDHDVVFRTIVTREDFLAIRGALFNNVAAWKQNGAWQWSRPLFLLETGAALIGFARGDARDVLTAASELVLARPNLPGEKPAEDRREVLFHRIVVALFTGASMPNDAAHYLDTLSKRLTAVATTGNEPRVIDPHLTLARAIVLDAETAPILEAVRRAGQNAPPLVAGPDDGTLRRHLEANLHEFEGVRDSSSLDEANVRRGLVLYRLRRAPEALQAFDRATMSADVDVRYWSRLFRARALESLGRLDEAVAAYEDAAAIEPHAQSVAVSLAAVFLRLDRRADALKWAEAARTEPANASDPWWNYWTGDARFERGWLVELRTALR